MSEPELRFRADDGNEFPEWEEENLKDAVTKVCVGFVGTCEKYYVNKNGVPLYRTGNLKDGHLVLDDLKFVTPDFHQKNKKSQLQYNDILVARHGDNGKAVLFDRKEDANCLNIVIVRPDNKKAIPAFLFQLINSPIMERQVNAVRAGSTQEVINTSEIELLKVNIPCLEEQQKIADLFSTLDNVIDSVQKEVDSWEQMKRGVMQKLFSQEVRFKADDGSEFPEWEEKPLCELCDVFTDGNWIESKDQSDFGIRLIQTGNIGITEFIDKPGTKKWISESTFNKLHCTEVLPDDILISRLPDPAGRACIVPDMGTKMITAVDCTIIRTGRNCSNQFLVQYLATSKYFNDINIYLAGGTRQRISRSNLAEIMIPLPCLSEQQKIADCLSEFDSVIERTKQKLEAYKQLKKGLMQRMFI